MADLDWVRELIEALRRAEESDAIPWAGMGPLVCARLDHQSDAELSDGDGLFITDVVVVNDEDGAHIEVIVSTTRESAPAPQDAHP